jgi:hypothetical protein
LRVSVGVVFRAATRASTVSVTGLSFAICGEHDRSGRARSEANFGCGPGIGREDGLVVAAAAALLFFFCPRSPKRRRERGVLV